MMSRALSEFKAYRMAELEEIFGDLHSIDQTDIDLVALVGKIPVILPQELEPCLAEMIGKKIGILQLDGYHIRELEN
jgi:hypothetical protein